MNPELKLRSLWLFIGYALVAFIVFLSVTSNPVQLNIGVVWQDKVYHVFAYCVLMFWFVQIYHGVRQQVFIAILLSSMGVLMEYIQSFDPLRYAEYADMVANVAGVLIALMLSKTPLKNTLLKCEQLFL